MTESGVGSGRMTAYPETIHGAALDGPVGHGPCRASGRLLPICGHLGKWRSEPRSIRGAWGLWNETDAGAVPLRGPRVTWYD